MATAITKKPAKPSSVTISRSTTDLDKFVLKWKKATTTGEAAVEEVYVAFYYQRYDDADGVWRKCKNGSYTVTKTATTKSHVIDSVDSSSTNIKKVKGTVVFKNSYIYKKSGRFYEKENTSEESAVITMYPVDSPKISASTSAGNLLLNVSFPNEQELKPLKEGSKVKATTYSVTKSILNGATSTVTSRGYGDTSKSVELAGYNLGTLSPSTPVRFSVSATVDGSVKYKKSDGTWSSNKTATANFYASKPNTPTVDSVVKTGNSYRIAWSGKSDSWHPIESYAVMYADVPQNQTTAAPVGSQTTIEEGLKSNSYTTTITEEIPVGMKRRFAVQSVHYGIVSDVQPFTTKSLYGEPEPPVSVTVSGKNVTVTAGEKCAPSAKVNVYREQQNNSGFVGSFQVSNGLTQTVVDNKAATGSTIRYYARTVNSGYGDSASEATYSDSTVMPNDTSFTSWTKSDDCETAYLKWKKPSGSVSGYEVAWADASDAFSSNKQPSTLRLDGSGTLSCHIRDLEPGKQYWFWIRTVTASGGTEYFSGWKNGGTISGAWKTATLLMANAPDEPGIILSSDFVVAGRGSIGVSWSYTALGDSPQTSWSVTVSKTGFSRKYCSTDKGRHALDESITIDTTGFPSGTLTVKVEVSNKIGKASSTAQFEVAAIPTATLAIASAITAQPVGVTVTAGSSNPLTTEYVVEFENVGGIVQQLPNGERVQYDGTVIGSFSVPSGQSSVEPLLIDGGRYRARVVSTDTRHNLSSASDWSELSVEWAHQAEPPSLEVTEGEDSAVVWSPDWDGTDSLSIWRVTKDGVTLAVENAEQTKHYSDQYVPFGTSHYRASIETADGDVAFTDWSAEIPSQDIRFDYGGNFVTLAYNITNGDTRDSGDEVKRFLDGSKSAITKRGTNRTHSLTAALVRGEDDDTLTRLYALSRYDGVCFVRTPDGMAYPAIVTVGIDMEAKSPLANVTITCTEVDDLGVFQASEVV